MGGVLLGERLVEVVVNGHGGLLLGGKEANGLVLAVAAEGHGVCGPRLPGVLLGRRRAHAVVLRRRRAARLLWALGFLGAAAVRALALGCVLTS